MRQVYTHYRRAFAGTLSGARSKTLFLCLMLLAMSSNGIAQTTLGGVNLGNLPQYLFVFTDARDDANWQSASKGYVGNVAIDGIQAKERTSGSFAYAGTIFTNAANLDAWQNIVNNNAGQANGVFNETTRITNLTNDLESAFTQINALTVTPGYASRTPTSLNGLNTQNGTAEVFVINITSDFQVSTKINITGDANDIFILRWDTDANFSDGYEGQVKFQSGGAIVPLGNLKPTNFIHVAGDINSSGGGSNPSLPYPQGPRLNDGTGNLINGASNFSGGGFFTGYWLTTGKPDKNDGGQPYGKSSSMSNAIFVGGWYSKATEFSMTSGTSGVYVSPPTNLNCPATNAGPDQIISCTNNQLPTSFDLVDAPAGQTWSIVSPVPAGANITVQSPSGNVTGTIVAGTYKFRLQATSDPQNCFDEVQVVVQPCGGGGFTDQICYESPDNPEQVSAKQEWKINPDNTITIRTTFSKTFVDNTYGTNVIGWGSKSHTFNNLVGSDKLELSLKDGNGVEKMNLVLDYISSSNTVPSGFKTLGVSGGEGKVNTGSASDVVDVKTSLSENLNTFGCVFTTNSPPTDANYSPSPSCPNWIYDVWYEVTVKQSVFGAAGFGSPSIVEVHASPSKTGNNTEDVVPGPCPVVCVNPPNAGANQTLGCDSNNQPPTSFDLIDAIAGQKWKIVSVPAGASITVQTPSGNVSGTIVSGIYTFRLQDQSDSLNCFDEVNVIVQCGPGGGDEICYVSPTKPQQVSAKQEWTINPDQTVTIRTTFSKTFVDNTYGTTAIGWGAKGHTFNNLVGSDKLELALQDANGVEQMYLEIDYISDDDNAPSGFATEGVTKVETGNESDVVSARTSLSENLNTLGCSSFTTNSPPTDANYTPSVACPNWIYDVWYEVTVKLSAFGAAGFGQPVIAEVHASPSKTGNNTEVVVPGSCPVATAQGGSACVGESITLQGTSAPAGATFKWTGPNGFTSNQLSPVLSNLTLAQSGVYTLTVTFNQLTDTDTARVTVFPKPAKPVASVAAQNCIGKDLQLNVTAESGVTFSWTGPNNFTSTQQNPIIPNATAAASGQYIVTITKSGCTNADTINVDVVNCCPVITTNDTRDTLCSGYYGEFFIANYTDLGTNGIKFVRFTSPQTASTVYSGGVEVTPSSFSNGTAQWPVGQPGSQFPANNGTTPVNYYVYAILSTTPTDPQCRPFAEKIYTILPLPTFAATAQPACTYDQSFVLNVNIATAGTYTVVFARNLTTVGNGPVPVDVISTQSGVPGAAITPFNVPIAEANGFFVFITNEATGCSVVGPSGSATITPKPNAGQDQVLPCAEPISGTLQTTTTLSFSPAGGTWSAQAGNPAQATVNNSGQVTGMSVAGTYRFIYNVNGCLDTVAVTVQPCQGCVKPNAGQDVSICEPISSVTLTGFSPAGGTWSVAAGNPAGATVTNAGVVSDMTVNGTYRFVYTVQQGGQFCSDTVAIIRKPKPNAGADQTICAPQTSLTLSGFTPAGGTWSAQANNPANATINNSGAVSGMTANGTYRFIYTVDGCTDTVNIIRNPKPVAGPDQSICEPISSINLTGFSPAGGTWSAQAGNPSATTITNTGAVSGMSANGTYRFIYTVNGCTDTVSVQRIARPNAGNDLFVCEPISTISLSGFSPAGGTWTPAAGNPAAATISNAGVVSGMVANGTYRFVYTVAQQGITCSDTVEVVRRQKPNAGPDQSICEPIMSLTLSGFSPGGGNWTAQSGNPASAAITNTGTISGMTANGIYRFIYTINGCADTVAIERKLKPTAGQDKTLECADPVQGTLQTTTTLTGFSPAGGSWTTQPGNPAAATVTNSGNVSGMVAAGTYRFIYTLNGCADTVAVTVQACQGCTKPDAGADQNICEPITTTTLIGFSPAGGSWTPQFGNPANASVTNAGVVTGMIANGTYRFVYTVLQGGQTCSDTVLVIRNAKPNAGSDQTLACADPIQGTLQTTTTLTGFSPAGGSWTAQAGNPASATVTNQGAVSGMTVAGTYRFIYTLNGCADTVSVVVQPCQGCVKPNAGEDVAICEPISSVALTGFSPSGGTWSVAAGNPAGATVPNAGVVSGLTVNGNYRFVYSVVQGGQTCTDTVAVTRRPKPNAGPDQFVCEPITSATLTGFLPAGGTWSVAAGNPAGATVNNQGQVSGMTTNGSYQFVYTLNGCTDTVMVMRRPKPNAGPDQFVCEPISNVTLTGFTPAGGTWSVA
jgi:hypothetical protein